MQEEISIADLWRLFLKHAFRIFSVVLLCVILAISFMIFFVKPKYESTAQLLVNQQETNLKEAPIQYSELQASSQLINTYRDIITGDSVLSQVSQEMNNDYSIGELQGAIAVEQSPNSQAFNITVQLDSPKGAQDVLYNVVSIFEETVRDVYGAKETNIFILSPASYNPNRVSPSLPIYAIIGTMIGLGLSVLLVLISEISDTTVKDDDFMTSLGLNNLGKVYELSAKDLKQSRMSTVKTNKRNRKMV